MLLHLKLVYVGQAYQNTQPTHRSLRFRAFWYSREMRYTRTSFTMFNTCWPGQGSLLRLPLFPTPSQYTRKVFLYQPSKASVDSLSAGYILPFVKDLSRFLPPPTSDNKTHLQIVINTKWMSIFQTPTMTHYQSSMDFLMQDLLHSNVSSLSASFLRSIEDVLFQGG